MTAKIKILIPFLVISFLMTCCNNDKVDEFTIDELKWFKPFSKTDTIVFISEKNDKDTIIFHKTVGRSHSRSGFEGYSKSNYLTVPYEFTKGSYHQFAMMSDGQTRYDQDILHVEKSSGYSSIGIVFIGTIFRDETLQNIQMMDSTTYLFDTSKGDQAVVNVEKGINDFTFNTDLGIIKYTDDRGVKWVRE